MYSKQPLGRTRLNVKDIIDVFYYCHAVRFALDVLFLRTIMPKENSKLACKRKIEMHDIFGAVQDEFKSKINDNNNNANWSEKLQWV